MYKNLSFKTIWKIICLAIIILVSVMLVLLNNFETIRNLTKTEIGSFEKISGSGTEASPFLIRTVDDLKELEFALDGEYYKLANDIDLTGVTDLPIFGTTTYPFKANFDGDGHTVKNLTIESSEKYVGLFGYVSSNATFKNIVLDNVYIKATGNAQNVGGLLGYYPTWEKLENIKVTGTIEDRSTGESHIGGVVGYTYSFNTNNLYGSSTASEINNCSFEGTITSNNGENEKSIGGIIGTAAGRIVVNRAYANVEIVNDNDNISVYAGSIIGLVLNCGRSSITETYAEGTINTSKGTVGGLVGSAILRNYFTDKVTYSREINLKFDITNSYSHVNITSDSAVAGGIIGKCGGYFTKYDNSWKSGTITYIRTTYIFMNTNIDCTYAVGKITTQSEDKGGIFGSSSSVSGSYPYDGNTRTYSKSTSLTKSYWAQDLMFGSETPKTQNYKSNASHMMRQNTYTDWDFENLWRIEEGKSFPYFSFNEVRIEPDEVKVRVYISGTTTGIPGAVIALVDEDGNVLKDQDSNDITKQTLSNGSVDFTTSLSYKPEIKYYYKQISAPEGYAADNNIYYFMFDQQANITYNDNSEDEGIIYNESINAKNVIITKYETGTTKPVAGAEISLYIDASASTAVIGTDGNPVKAITGSDGKIDFATKAKLMPGTYYYKETNAPTGYIQNNTIYQFTVDSLGNVTYGSNDGIIYNEKLSTYRICYYLRTLDREIPNYVLQADATVSRTDTVGKTVTVKREDIKSFNGFTYDTTNTRNVLSGNVLEDGSLELKLYYERDTYNIEYELNGGQSNNLPQTYLYGKGMILPNNVTKAGCEFLGWYEDSQLTQRKTKIETEETGDKKFYAKWSVEDDYYITSDKYSIDTNISEIISVNPDSNLERFKSKIKTNGTMKVVNLQNQEISSTDLVGTGYELQVTYKGNVYKYKISVKGDINGDGKVQLVDLSMMNQAIIGKTTLTGVNFKAADINGDGDIKLVDLSMMNQAILGKMTL